MKKLLPNKKGFFALLLALGLGLGTAYAYDFSKNCTTGQTLYYNIIDATNHYVELTYPGEDYFTAWDGFVKPTGNITLPSSVTYNGVTYTVKAIDERAFDECTGLTGSLTIPNSVTTIGTRAFYGCSGFTGTLTLSNSLTTIGHSGFFGCDFTGSLTIPDSVTHIGNYAFSQCNGFTGTLTLGNSLIEIGEGAFEFARYLSGNLILPNSLTTIGFGAFLGCQSLTGSLTIPDSVTEIGTWAFYYCYGFSGTLIIGTGVTSIGSSVFKNCGSFTQVYYNAVNCADVTAEDKPFEDLTGTLTIGNTVQRIPANLFYQCTGLTGPLTIPNSVTEIGEGAFAYCDGFTGDLTIGKYVTYMGDNAFRDCTGFTHLNYNAIHSADLSSTDHDNIPFKNFSGTLSIGDEVQRIPRCMFYDCSGFTGSLIIPNSVTSIGYGAFYRCSHLTSLYLGNSLTTIDTYAFYNWSRLTGTVTIPESVTTIGINAFAGCHEFTSLVIGSNVNTINNGAFSYCSSLSSITVRAETPPALGENMFEAVSMDIPVYVPCGSLSAYQAAYGWSNFTNYQCIPWTVTLSANPWGGGYVDFTDSNGDDGNYANGTMCTVLATPHDDYLFMHWTRNGTVVSSNTSYSFNVYEDTDLEAVFMALSDAGDIIGEGTSTNMYLPSSSYYNYSLTEQIYTADELAGISTITSISFFNEGPTKTRTLAIYLMHTNKEAFSSTTDWISASLSNVAGGGSVTMRSGMWTTIMLNTPFVYNGTSNLLLVVDDNTGDWSYSPHMACRTYAANGNQTLRVCSDGTNYAPNSPSSYNGTIMQVKNQIMLNRVAYNINATSADETAGMVSGGGQYGQGDQCSLKATPNTGYTFLSWTDTNGMVVSTEAEYSFFVTENRTLVANFLTGTDVCSLTFDLYDSYGDGWNGNYLVVDFGDGVSQRLTVTEDMGLEASYTLPVVNGSHVELSWIQGSWAYECFFKVCYSNESIEFVSIGVDLNSSFEYEFDVDCDEMPANWAFLGYDDNGGSNYLPSYSYFNYSLTQQIYTTAEIGAAGGITSIAFYNENYEEDDNTKTRTYDIYLKATDKNEFFTSTDWINVTEEDKVFSGEVTLTANKWTLITFDIPFEYDGTSNLALIVDDNTGGWTSAPHMSCRTYYYNGDNQAIYVYSDDINYNPNSPSAYNGTLMGEKNQVYFGFTDFDCIAPFHLNATDITEYSATLSWTGYQESYNVRYRMEPYFYEDFENGLVDWTVIRNNEGNSNTDWQWYDASFMDGGSNHSGDFVAQSRSWMSGDAFSVDNWLITPQVTLDGTLSFWVRCNADYPDHYQVYVSTSGNAINDFSPLNERAEASGVWTEITLDLSAFAGTQGYIAIRHQDEDEEYLWIDDFGIYLEEGTDGWVELNGVTNPVNIQGLIPNTTYEWQVQGINASCSDDGLTEWSDLATFTTAEVTAVTQTVALSSGYNWFSTNVDITLDDLKAALVAALPGTNITISSQNNGSTTYNGSIWRGTLNTLDVTQMYKIKTVANCQIVLTGAALVPAEHPITIHNGANWIGFPLNANMSLSNAFAGFSVSGDMVRSKDGSATYNGTNWRGNFNTLVPGQGYIYMSNTTGDRTLTFPAGAK